MIDVDAPGVIAVGAEDRLDVLDIGTKRQVVAVSVEVAEAGEQRGLLLRTFLVLGRRAIVAAQFHTLEILAQDEVDDTRDGIAAIDRGGAVFQDFDPFNRRQRNAVDVDRSTSQATGATAIHRHPATIDQHQRARTAQPAQRHRRDRTGLGTGRGCRRYLASTAEGADLLDQLLGRGGTGTLDVFALEDLHRQRSFRINALDRRPGNFNPLDLDCRLGSLAKHQTRCQQHRRTRGSNGQRRFLEAQGWCVHVKDCLFSG